MRTSRSRRAGDVFVGGWTDPGRTENEGAKSKWWTAGGSNSRPPRCERMEHGRNGAILGSLSLGSGTVRESALADRIRKVRPLRLGVDGQEHVRRLPVAELLH